MSAILKLSRSMAKRIILLLVCIVISAEALAVGVECHCPEYFKEAEVNTMWCIVNTTAVQEAKCISEQKNINMDLASKSSPDTLSIPCNEINLINSKDHCECTNISADLLNCTVHIFGNRARDEGKELTCKPCVRPRNLNVTSTGCCEHITFVPGSSGTTSSGGMVLSAFCLLLVFIGTH